MPLARAGQPDRSTVSTMIGRLQSSALSAMRKMPENAVAVIALELVSPQTTVEAALLGGPFQIRTLTPVIVDVLPDPVW